MGLMKKKKLAAAAEKREDDLKYLLNSFASELEETEKKLKNLAYQMEFFGSTPELTEKKKDAKLLMGWIQDQFQDIQKSQLLNYS
ncbi:MAG: hypothetical protein ACTSYI_06015 [Promethearchaeota archaeon]